MAVKRLTRTNAHEPGAHRGQTRGDEAQPVERMSGRPVRRRDHSSAWATGRCSRATIRTHMPQTGTPAQVRAARQSRRGRGQSAGPQPTHGCFRRAQICVLTHRKSADSSCRKMLWAHRFSRVVDLCVLMARTVAACQTRAPVPVARAVTACRSGAPPPHAGSHGGTPERHTSQPRASWPSRRWRQSRLPGWRPRAAPWARRRWRPRWSTPCPQAWDRRRA